MTLPPPPPTTAPESLGRRWRELALAAGVAPDERLCLALSGGADSVFLLHAIAAARPRPSLVAVHVDHGLRGAASDADARFCAEACARLAVPFLLRRVALDAGLGSLEARAREARYRALADAARTSGHTTVVTGHHADDALETLLLRWMRGSVPAALVGARRSARLPGHLGGADDLRLVRPLAPLRREEVREGLAARGLAWREDASNADPRHNRTLVRHGLVPALERWCGAEGLDHLRAFARSAERLEQELARATAHLAWSPARRAWPADGPYAPALHGGALSRAQVMRLPRALRRRALWRLLTEAIGAAPGAALLEGLLDDLACGRCTRHALPHGRLLQLRADSLLLLPPEPAARPLAPGLDLELAVPGSVRLADGRRIRAERVALPGHAPVPRSPWQVELDARALPAALRVRLPRPGDRFHALGAPGSKPLGRYLAGRGLPREERRSLPLVLAGEELVWVPGCAPCDPRRVQAATAERLRLTLEPAARGDSAAQGR